MGSLENDMLRRVTIPAANLTRSLQSLGVATMSQVGVRFGEVMKGWVAVPQANFGYGTSMV